VRLCSSRGGSSCFAVSSLRYSTRTPRISMWLVLSNFEHARSEDTSKEEVRRASERVDAPRALPGSRLSFGSLSSPSPSGSAAARRGPLQGVLETPVTFPSRAVRSVKEESRRGRSTMRTASFCKTALSLFVHPGFIGSPSACHQSGGFPATGPSAQRHFSSVQRWTTSRCGSGRRCLAVGCLCSHFPPRAFSLFLRSAGLARTFLFFCAKSRVKHFCLTLLDFFCNRLGLEPVGLCAERGGAERPFRATLPSSARSYALVHASTELQDHAREPRPARESSRAGGGGWRFDLVGATARSGPSLFKLRARYIPLCTSPAASWKRSRRDPWCSGSS